MAYLLRNVCTKNYWNRTTIVEIIVGGWVVSFFETQCSAPCPLRDWIVPLGPPYTSPCLPKFSTVVAPCQSMSQLVRWLYRLIDVISIMTHVIDGVMVNRPDERISSKKALTLLTRLRLVPRVNKRQTRMWANAQRDGRPAEYRWRPLFNAAKFG